MNRFMANDTKKKCRALLIVDELPEDLKKDYLEILDNPEVPTSRIEVIMRQEKHPISHTTIYRHRIGQCICPK